MHNVFFCTCFFSFSNFIIYMYISKKSLHLKYKLIEIPFFLCMVMMTKLTQSLAWQSHNDNETQGRNELLILKIGRQYTSQKKLQKGSSAFEFGSCPDFSPLLMKMKWKFFLVIFIMVNFTEVDFDSFYKRGLKEIPAIRDNFHFHNFQHPFIFDINCNSNSKSVSLSTVD